MNSIGPKLSSTQHSPDLREWVPNSFLEFLEELEHINKSCEGEDSIALFRGQSNYAWGLDSTIVRNFIGHCFKISKTHELYDRTSLFHQILTDCILFKFGVLTCPSADLLDLLNPIFDKNSKVLHGPSAGLLAKEKSAGIDPWFEMIKYFQQFPERDESFIKGTFWLDWSTCQDIALYFAVYDGTGSNRTIRENHGAVWIFDAASTGKILQTEKVTKIVDLMNAENFRKKPASMPLMFHPPKQTHMKRAEHQQAVYLAQMDYQHDLADVWATHGEIHGKKVFIKLILKDSLKKEAAKYLETQGITEEFIYPED